MDMARDCGVTEDNALLWIGVLKIVKDEDATYFFLRSSLAGRLLLSTTLGSITRPFYPCIAANLSSVSVLTNVCYVCVLNYVVYVS